MARSFRFSWELAFYVILLLYPFFPGFESTFFQATGRSLGDQLPTVFIFCILALGLNVIVGYTGILHLGIAAFFALGVYAAGILGSPAYAFNAPFLVIVIAGVALAKIFGLGLSIPTLRLRGDYLAIVTLGFGEVMKFSLNNLDPITAGSRGLSPIKPPTEHAFWIEDFRGYYYLTLIILILVVLVLRNIEKSRLGRGWIALREDELASHVMGLNPGKLKLLALSLGCGLAGLAGVLYATRLTSTATPYSYDFNRSIFVLCCVILGGMGSRFGVVLGVFLLLGFDNILSPIIDGYIQNWMQQINSSPRIWMTFTGWRLSVFGLALILMMRFRPEGLIPERRVQLELHPLELNGSAIEPTTLEDREDSHRGEMN